MFLQGHRLASTNQPDESLGSAAETITRRNDNLVKPKLNSSGRADESTKLEIRLCCLFPRILSLALFEIDASGVTRTAKSPRPCPDFPVSPRCTYTYVRKFGRSIFRNKEDFGKAEFPQDDGEQLEPGRFHRSLRYPSQRPTRRFNSLSSFRQNFVFT